MNTKKVFKVSIFFLNNKFVPIQIIFIISVLFKILVTSTLCNSDSSVVFALKIQFG